MSFSEELMSWYDAHRRSLPWRGEREPYRIWLSEIMLQQTQTETVKGYYARFLRRFPTVFDLAEADEGEVLKLWEGLGYYSRARNLHAAARKVAREWEGRFPSDAAGLRTLPGVGPYAANAIASIAYDEPVPALDGNQARVLARVLAWEPEIRTPFDLLKPALELIDRHRPGDYNQALMDLGATICTPRTPDCGSCPVAKHCKALAADAVADFPRKPAPAVKKPQDWTIVLAFMEGKVLVRRRPRGLLGGLYEFCAVEGHPDAGGLCEMLTEMGFEGVKIVERLPDAKHVFTHRVWFMRGWRVRCDKAPEGFTAVDSEELRALPFPGALRIYREIAEKRLTAVVGDGTISPGIQMEVMMNE